MHIRSDKLPAKLFVSQSVNKAVDRGIIVPFLLVGKTESADANHEQMQQIRLDDVDGPYFRAGQRPAFYRIVDAVKDT
ncbi:hypothetical protein [Bradyrhizobium zhanjiangense]|uniref:hypothetical protein n=1 Tax=Bradyrhizobium zhanjiangense TaxID=1325107 RepID=UPI0013E8E130|nr:hypothetical protein [Bradyrhizobium zhanjiangense]